MDLGLLSFLFFTWLSVSLVLLFDPLRLTGWLGRSTAAFAAIAVEINGAAGDNVHDGGLQGAAARRWRRPCLPRPWGICISPPARPGAALVPFAHRLHGLVGGDLMVISQVFKAVLALTSTSLPIERV